METKTVQTFLPYPDFQESVKVLHLDLLLETQVWIVQILDILHEVETDSLLDVSEPVVDMWRGHEPQLCEYGLEVSEELPRRPNVMASVVSVWVDKLNWHLDMATSGEYNMDKPKWFGDMEVHLGHQAYLMRTYPEHAYTTIFADTPSDLPYVWPVA